MTYKISLNEPFDFDTHDMFKNEIDTALEDGNKEIIIDLASVEQMDSSAIGMLIIAYKSSMEYGAKIKVIGANNLIYEMLYLTQLDKLFTIEKSTN